MHSRYNLFFNKIFIFSFFVYLAVLIIVFLIDFCRWYFPLMLASPEMVVNVVGLFIFLICWCLSHPILALGLVYLILIRIFIIAVIAILRFFKKFIEDEA